MYCPWQVRHHQLGFSSFPTPHTRGAKKWMTQPPASARSLLEPIIVRRRGAGYELIAGRHRFEAARNCGHQTIRAEVHDSLSDDEAAPSAY